MEDSSIEHTRFIASFTLQIAPPWLIQHLKIICRIPRLADHPTVPRTIIRGTRLYLHRAVMCSTRRYEPKRESRSRIHPNPNLIQLPDIEAKDIHRHHTPFDTGVLPISNPGDTFTAPSGIRRVTE